MVCTSTGRRSARELLWAAILRWWLQSRSATGLILARDRVSPGMSLQARLRSGGRGRSRKRVGSRLDASLKKKRRIRNLDHSLVPWNDTESVENDIPL